MENDPRAPAMTGQDVAIQLAERTDRTIGGEHDGG